MMKLSEQNTSLSSPSRNIGLSDLGSESGSGVFTEATNRRKAELCTIFKLSGARQATTRSVQDFDRQLPIGGCVGEQHSDFATAGCLSDGKQARRQRSAAFY